jgi:hypothetical protein
MGCQIQEKKELNKSHIRKHANILKTLLLRNVVYEKSRNLVAHSPAPDLFPGM